jgi:hypothetical protein
LAALAASAPAASADPAPAWTIRSLPAPTHFTPGDEAGRYQYEVRATNIGGAATDGSPITLTDTVPAGLTVKDVELPLRGPESAWDSFSELCEVEASGAVETVRCTVPEQVPEAVEPTVLAPAEQLRMVVLVSTPAGAEGSTLTNAVEVKGGAAGSASATSRNEAGSEPAPAGLTDFGAALLGADGHSNRAAGSIPYQYATSFAVNTRARFPSSPSSSGDSRYFDPAGGDVKDVRVALPPGLIGDPTVASRCSAQQFNTSHTTEPFPGIVVVRNDCPDGSAVGLVVVEQLEGRGGTIPVPLYNLVPPKGMPAQLGFQVLGAPFYIDTELRSGGDYGVTASLRNTTEIERVSAATVIVWGVPSDPRHDPVRGSCLNTSPQSHPYSLGSCTSGLAVKRFLRSPTSCESPLLTTMSFDTWTDPGAFVSATSTEPPLINCAPLDFSPTISAVPHTTVADSPTGLRFNLHLPQSADPNLLATADLRDAVITLPEGVTVNPASANGLAGCSPAEVDLHGPGPAQCPEAAKVGSVEIDTPLLDHPVEGAVYVANQNDNPFDSLLAIYIAVHDPQSGVVVKLAGHVVPDPNTGRLTTRFADNPQLPFEDFRVEFFDGPRAPLRTPATCGSYATTTALTPFSAPESGPAATPSDSFTVTTAPGGGPCAPSEAAQPHSPSFSAGTLAPVAGSYSPLVTNLRREDGSQNLRGLKVTLPPGLVGRLAGIPYCPQSAIEQAEHRKDPGEGALERAAPSCPAASQVGTATVGSGAGSSPVYVQGKAYLAGPYRGAPLSLAVVTPAIAGPFDLGTVVVRAALYVDPETTRVTVASDPIPTILQGIPLDVRSISVNADRPGFTLNPTNCEPMAVRGEALSLANQIAPLAERFQVGGCRGLDFAPRLALRLEGASRRAGNPRLIATLQARPGEANIARAQVKLPAAAFLDNSHIKTICTRIQFAADQCPKASTYGRASATTPLLDYELTGPVYLSSSSHQLPDLMVKLKGPERQPIEVDLAGRTDSVHGALRNTFEAVPDAPVSRFRLELFGGRRGLIELSRNLCAHPYRASVHLVGQNGKLHDTRPLVGNSCREKRPKARHLRAGPRR